MNAPTTPRSNWQAATLFGLLVALGGPALSPLIFDVLFGSSEQTPARVVWGLAIHWINLLALIAIVLWAERQPLTSLGLHPITVGKVALGLLAGVVILLGSGALIQALQLNSDQSFTAMLMSLPFVTRLLVALTAGIFEETLYRGYALERLATLFNSKWAAGAVTLLFFTLGHVPSVGWAHIAPVFVVSFFVTLLYLWRRDLVVNMIAHATIDGIGLLVVPALTRAAGH